MTAITFLQGAGQGGVPIWLLLKHWVVQMAWETVEIIAGKQMKLGKLDSHLDHYISRFVRLSVMRQTQNITPNLLKPSVSNNNK